MSIAGWWSQRPGMERFDLSTRSPLYLVSALEPVTVVILLEGQDVRPEGTGMLLVLALAHTISCLALLRAALEHRIGGPPPRAALLAGAVALTGAGLAVAPQTLPDYGRLVGSDGFPVGLAVCVLFGGALTAAVTPILTRSQLVAAVVAPALAAGAAQLITMPGVEQAPWTLNYLLIVGMLVLMYRSSAWVLGLVWEIDRARNVEARLAVAEERLRVTRDLHDVLGRNLTLIAVTSELAAGLVVRDNADAAQRMLSVRQLAQDSMRDVREVVGGRRTADLDAELAGTRSVLRAAGIDTRVTGDSAGLPPGVRSALGWVIREASTNILRHATPQRVTIRLDAVPTPGGAASARLRIENDGARLADAAPAADGHGHGLDGLRDRLSGRGGRLVASRLSGGRFRIEARLPFERHEESGS